MRFSIVMTKRFKQLEELAEKAGVEHIATFGENARSDYRLREVKLHPTCSCMTVKIGTHEAAVKVGMPGRHIVQNMLAVLGAADLVGADIAKVMMAMATLSAAVAARAMCFSILKEPSR